jgi:hypothetical protein
MMFAIYPSASADEPCAYVQADDPAQAMERAKREPCVEIYLEASAFAERWEDA